MTFGCPFDSFVSEQMKHKLIRSLMKNMIFYLFAAVLAAVLTISCKKDPVAETSFELERTSIEFPAEGGAENVGYSITNPSDGLSVRCGETPLWLKVSVIADDNLLTIEAEENSSAQARQAEFVLSYGDVENKLSVVQAAAGPALVPFAVSFGKITEVSVSVDIEPSDSQMTYSVLSVPGQTSSQYPSDDEMFALIVEFYTEAAAEYGMSLQDFITYSRILVKGAVDNASIGGLDPETEYALLVFGMDASGNRLSPIVREPFATKAVEMVDITFELDVTVSGPDADMKVTPSSDEYGYFAYNVTKQRLADDAGGDLDVFVQGYVDMVFSFLTGLGGMSSDEALRKMLSWGEFTYEFELAGNTEYVGYAACVNSSALVCSSIAMAEFVTGDVLPSDNEIRVTLSNINVDRVDYKVETTNDDQYYFEIDAVKYYEGMSDEEILAKLSKFVWSWDLNRGDISGTWDLLEAGTDYYVLVFGYYGAQSTTDLMKMEFTTMAEAEDPSDFILESRVYDIGVKTAKADVKGNPHSVLYYWDICPSYMEASEVREALDDEIDRILAQDDFYTGRKMFMLYNCTRNTDSREFVDVIPGDYKVYAVPVDENTWEFAGDAVFGGTFSVEGEYYGTGREFRLLKPLVKDAAEAKSSRTVTLVPPGDNAGKPSKNCWDSLKCDKSVVDSDDLRHM